MWTTFTSSLLAVLLLGTEVSQGDDVGIIMDESSDNVSSFLGRSREQILAAQFECYLKIIHDPPRSQEGTFCNRTWDGWLCWGDAAPGTVMQMCPGYFQDFDPEEKVTKVCNPDGQWFHHPESNRVWSNYTQCEAYTKEKRKFAFSLYYLAMVGQGLSIVSLVISLVIFSYFRSLSCQRISIHKNMFLSFILSSVFTVIWLSAVATNQQLLVSNPISCKVLYVINQYTVASNYFWMLCEGIYLHTLIIVAVFVGEQQLFWYYVLGWGFPVVPAITYAVGRELFFNDKCWIRSDTHLLYIIHGPIQAALLVNFFFLLNIVRVLITKLKVTHRAESNAYMKAVRATLILMPLLGAQFILVPWRPEGRMARAVYELVMNIFAHFQGLLVAIIFCFCNAEAQTALRRKWAQWKVAWGKTGWGETPMTNNSANYHTNSVTETSRATINLEPPAVTPHYPLSNHLSRASDGPAQWGQEHLSRASDGPAQWGQEHLSRASDGPAQWGQEHLSRASDGPAQWGQEHLSRASDGPAQWGQEHLSRATDGPVQWGQEHLSRASDGPAQWGQEQPNGQQSYRKRYTNGEADMSKMLETTNI